MNTTIAQRESARHNDGRFGEQDHTEPEVGLTPAPDFRSAHARRIDDKLAALRAERDRLMGERREEHLLDIARHLPASITRVTFRTEYDRDGEKHMLMFDSAEDERDIVNLDTNLTNHLYAVAWDFGQPGDFVADEWMDGEDEHYWVNLDEETALQYASEFRQEMQAAQRTAGIAPLPLHYGHTAWTERAMRVRAHQAGITAIHLNIPEDASGTEVVSFEHVDRGIVPVDDGDNDHMFIVAQARQLPHPTDTMTKSGIAGAHLTLKV